MHLGAHRQRIWARSEEIIFVDFRLISCVFHGRPLNILRPALVSPPIDVDFGQRTCMDVRNHPWPSLHGCNDFDARPYGPCAPFLRAHEGYKRIQTGKLLF